MIIRPAQPDDAEAIGRIRVDAWRQAYRELLPVDFLSTLNPSQNLVKLKNRLREQSGTFFADVSEFDGLVQGFSISGAPRYKTSEKAIELWALNVAPEYWGNGLGFGLLRQCCDAARENGARKVELWCISKNRRAIELYERFGFLLTGRERTTTKLTGHPLHELCYEYVPDL